MKSKQRPPWWPTKAQKARADEAHREAMSRKADPEAYPEGPGVYGGPEDERIATAAEREALKAAGWKETALQTLWINPRIARGVLEYLAAMQADHIDQESGGIRGVEAACIRDREDREPDVVQKVEPV